MALKDAADGGFFASTVSTIRHCESTSCHRESALFSLTGWGLSVGSARPCFSVVGDLAEHERAPVLYSVSP